MLSLIRFWIWLLRSVTIYNNGRGSFSPTGPILIIVIGDVAVARHWFVDDLLAVAVL